MQGIDIVRYEDLDPANADRLHRLRHKVFFEKLNWDVPSIDGREIDEFDVPGTVHLISRGDDGEVVGCMRLMPTTGPYMLRDTFPELLRGQPAIEADDVWEVSRFAINAHASDAGGFGFGGKARSLIATAYRFAVEHGVRRYVLVTSVAVERLLVSLGVHIHRIAPPMKIGLVRTVACIFECDEDTRAALFD